MYFLQELSLPILITASLQYLLSCFPLVFLEGCCTTLSSEEMLMTFFHLASTIWGASMSSKRAVSSAKTLSQSYFKYFTYFHLFSSSTSLYFSALGLIDFLCFLHSLLNTASFSCLFHAGLELLLLFMLLLYLLVLLFKHFCISLGNVRRWGRRHDNIKKSKIFFLFMYC